MQDLKIEYLKVKDLKPYEKNTRKHKDLDVDNIAKSIDKYGFNDPIGIWKGNIIIEGHGRLEAAKKLGFDEVPCIRLDHLTDEERREYAIAHNATAELSEWDTDFLAEELADIDLSGFDFDFGIKSNNQDDGNNPYTKTINIPQYEPKEETKNIEDIYDLEKYNNLVEKIENSSISESEKKVFKICGNKAYKF